MKIKTINRIEEQYTRERNQDVKKVHRNLDPSLHAMEGAHEYVRALNAVKLEKIFARPFVGALAHNDGVTSLAKNPKRLNSILAGSGDGQIRLWDIAGRRLLRSLDGHRMAVSGIAVTRCGHNVVSSSEDGTVRLWKVPAPAFEPGPVAESQESVMEYVGKSGFRGIDHHWEKDMFATAGAAVDVWDHERSEPIQTFEWGADNVINVKFNPAEPDLFASCGADRSIALYDLRSGTPVRKVVMQTRCNSLAWNPIEAFNFTVANEDCNLYSYDMRKLDIAACVHKDFVSSVMDVDYSPTGREFVAGSYDRTIRIFKYNGGHSREVYHTKRMQRVVAVQYSMDSTYVLSGSDDMNVRVWKADAAEQLGTVLAREKHKHAYNKALVEKHKHLPEIRKISRDRKLPKEVLEATKVRRNVREGEKRRENRRREHSAPGSVPYQNERKRKIITQLE